jgi:hypothetical protein
VFEGVLRAPLTLYSSVHASREIHDKLVTAVMGTTFRCAYLIFPALQPCLTHEVIGGWTRHPPPGSKHGLLETSKQVRVALWSSLRMINGSHSR